MYIGYVIPSLNKNVVQTVDSNTFNTLTGDEPEFAPYVWKTHIDYLKGKKCIFKGWTFRKKWCSKKEGVHVLAGSSYTYDKDIQCYPWYDTEDATKYSVTIDGVEVYSNWETSQYKVRNPEYKKYYAFLYYQDQDSNFVLPGDLINLDKDYTLTSVYVPIEFTIRYSYSGSEVIITVDPTINPNYTFPDDVFSKSGHRIGWYEDPNKLRYYPNTTIQLESNLNLTPIFLDNTNSMTLKREDMVDEIAKEMI